MSPSVSQRSSETGKTSQFKVSSCTVKPPHWPVNMMSTVEELQEEMAGELYTLEKDKLFEICDFLKISGDQRAIVQRKSRLALINYILTYLQREELSELEDEGMAELLSLKELSKFQTYWWALIVAQERDTRRKYRS